MVNICIKDHLVNASTYADGQIIFCMIKSHLEKGEIVVLSFEKILAVPSAFINAAILQLVEHFTPSEIKSKLKISNSTRSINDLIRNRLEFVEKNRN